MESYGVCYVKSFGGIDVFLNMDKLINEGWVFICMYVMGICFVCGIEVVIIGFFLMFVCFVVKLGKS